MTSSNLFELAIIAFIVLGIGAAIWRGGTRNPVGTGGLDRKISAFGNALSGVQIKVGEIEERVEKVESKAASAADIQRLEKQIERLAQTLPDIEARQRALSDRMGEHAQSAAITAAKVEHIDKQVGLIYQVLVPKGMER